LGNLIWSKQFGGAKGDYLQSLISLSNGNYAFGGYANSFIGTGSWPPFAYLLLQFDSSGNTVFCKQYPTGQSERCNAIAETHDGGIVMNGNIAKIKVDLFGNIIWKNAAGAGIDVFTMNNGNILFTGTPGILPVIKADSLGNLGCNQGILFIPQMVSLSENLLPMNFYESAFSPSDSVVSISLSNIQLTSTLNCLTATGTEDHFSEDAVTIFPNPFVSELFIKNNSFNSLSHISLINMFGQVVFSKKLDAADFDPLFLYWLPAGIYCMNLFFTDRNHSVSKKLIKVE
ncbi:MAG: T9SS type A sorting domain-containing protein, partial [Bacteroidia bacterium]|nr:T9SS type A sorting domain-containing protein [Bacteroidia bacterium]